MGREAHHIKTLLMEGGCPIRARDRWTNIVSWPLLSMELRGVVRHFVSFSRGRRRRSRATGDDGGE